jgi:HEAT repeat protein
VQPEAVDPAAADSQPPSSEPKAAADPAEPANTSAKKKTDGTGQQKTDMAAQSTGAGNGSEAQVRQWLIDLTSPDEQTRLVAIQSLDRVGDQAIAQAARLLETGRPEVRRACASYLVGRVGARHQQAIQTLNRVLSSDSPQLRHRAFQALERLPAQALAPTASKLAAMLSNPQEQTVYRVRAARAIGRLGRQAEPVLRTLEETALNAEDRQVRRAAFAALTETTSPEQGESFFLEVLASDASVQLRRLAAKWLGEAAATDRALQGLIDALDDPDAAVRREASAALVSIGRPAVDPLVETATSNGSLQKRRYAIYTLGKLGPLATEATAALRKLAEDEHPEIRTLAQAALQLVQRP